MIRERGEGPVDGVEYAGVEAAHAAARGARGDRRRARDRRRPVEPGHLDPPDPRRARDGRGAARRAGAGRRRLARRRRRDRQGPDRAVHGVARAAALSAAGVAAAYDGLLDGMVADERRRRPPPPRHRHAHGPTPPRAGASRRRRCASRSRLRVTHRRRPAGQALRRRQAAPRRRDAQRDAPRAGRGDAHRRPHRAAALAARRPGRRRHRASTRPTRSPRAHDARTIRDPDEPGHNPAAREGVRWAMEQGARARPARPRRLPGARPDRGRRPAARPPARRRPRHDRPGPPRHRHERARALPARRDRAELRDRQPRAPRAASRASAGAECRIAEPPSLVLDIDTLEDLAVLRAALDARTGGAAHTRGLLARLGRR